MMRGHLTPGRAIALALAAMALVAASPVPLQAACEDGPLNGAIIRICMPPVWNGGLVVFAHGYVSPYEPLAIPEDQLTLPDGTSIPGIVNGLGFAFATTSYSKNGLAVLPGIQNVADVVMAFSAAVAPPWRTYLVGASEGGLVTALAAERHPELFSGGVATCGPVGDFRRQINYWGDFRVLFDYFFPQIFWNKGPAYRQLVLPAEVRGNWESVYVPAITSALATNPSALDQLLRVSRAPFDAAVPATKAATVLGILWYNVFATQDAIDTLGGQPFANRYRFYSGSANDWLLNLRVKRYDADLPAVQEIEANYQTSGQLTVPVVTLHTTKDPIVPYWHEPLYSWKTLIGGSALLHPNLPVLRYGHCQFEPAEALVALGLLVLEVEGRELLGAESVLSTTAAREKYRALAETYGLRR